MSRQRIIMFALLAAVFLAAAGQEVIDFTLKRDFQAQVKSVDEFIARFNGDESKPGIKNDDAKRRNNIIALFDARMSHEGQPDTTFRRRLSEFIATCTDWDGRLAITGNGTCAEAECKIKYQGKMFSVTLLLRREPTAKTGGLRWGITGIRGLSALGIYSDKRLTISPVDHEVHFLSLKDLFGANRSLVPAMRSSAKEIDDLTMFLTLVMAKAVDFVQVERLRFCFTDVPGYVFRIEDIGREGTNSGWLITQFKEITEEEKPEYRNDMFGLSLPVQDNQE